MAEIARRLIEAVPHGLLVEAIGDVDGAHVIDLTHDSRDVRESWAFACVPGGRYDGHEFAAGAVAAGATLLLVERRLPLQVAQIVVTDVRRAMGPVAARIHGDPATKLRIVGITGTNGKTTTTHLVGSIMRAAGWSEREMGTLSGARTTPEAPDLQRRLAGFVDEGVEAVVMEVSSHALALHRVNGVHFDVAAFTNLGRDHLDLHVSMEAYFRAKASLFTAELAEVGVTNLDDPYGRLLLDGADIEMAGFRMDDAQDLEVGVGHHRFRWRGTPVSVPLGGRFNAANSLCALAIAAQLGIDADVAAQGLASIPPVPGRFEVVSDPDAPFSVVVDYAHTPDGLAELLSAVRDVHVGPVGAGRVICVFGCGGDRDRDKRPLMGAAAAAHADVVVATSDNPRHEDPRAIIDDAVAGVEPRYRDRVSIEVDRRAGIAIALRAARPGDAVVIAGKGHEPTQTIGDTASPFDDRDVARELLAEMNLRTPTHQNDRPDQPDPPDPSDDHAAGGTA
jgi:UDP-N-acetylmuramoyl-L-alanyl-D-glutamate--2,6-diaminopimelate ligase